MAKTARTETAAKAVSAPPEDKAVKSAPETKAPPAPASTPPENDPAKSAPETKAPTKEKSAGIAVRVVRQPLMTSEGVKAPGETFYVSERDRRRYGKLVKPVGESDEE